MNSPPSTPPGTRPQFSRDAACVVAETELFIEFQPIVSLSGRQTRLVEALARGKITGESDIIPPAELFARAEELGCALAFDRFCRRKALDSFAQLLKHHPDWMLCLNVGTSCFEPGIEGSGVLARQVSAAGIHPASIVLEILEGHISDTDALQRFVERHRSQGFLIALDDVGAGYSNLGRIPKVRPDILKIDRGLIHLLASDYHKQQVVSSIIGLAHRIGAIVIAEGVETESELMLARELGCDLIQGFLIAASQSIELIESEPWDLQLQELIERQKLDAIKRISNYRRSREHLHEVVKQAAQSIAELEFFPSTEHLVALFDYDETLDAVYVLDRLGIQRSHTIRRIDVDNPELAQAQDSALAGRSLFRPAPTGCDQSLKEYFIMLQAGLTHYLTAPYISTATGKFCVTGSESIEQKSGDRLIICCDFISSGPKLTS